MLRSTREGNLCRLKQFRPAGESGRNFIDWHKARRGYGKGWRMRDFEQTGIGNSRMLTSSRDPKEE